ncbi:MAG: SDR family oxidoreductase [Rhodospirillales bacterium]|nr:SDR family oxidoreductase [Rhodospirillales bacterium]
MDDTGRHPDCYPKAALVTGAARRIGRALALDLSRQGYAVCIHYKTSAADAGALVKAIEEAGGRAVALRADLVQEEGPPDLFREARMRLGPIGVLVNNASVFGYDDIACAGRESWEAHLDLNLRAPLVLTQAFAEALPPGYGGAVVNMIDARVLRPTPRYLSYTVSKAGLWALTQSLARALAPCVRVNAIGPGPVLPPGGQSAAAFAARCRRLPLRRPADLPEICAALRFLLAAKSVTGQLLTLDGGDRLADDLREEGLFPASFGRLTGDTAA